MSSVLLHYYHFSRFSSSCNIRVCCPAKLPYDGRIAACMTHCAAPPAWFPVMITSGIRHVHTVPTTSVLLYHPTCRDLYIRTTGIGGEVRKELSARGAGIGDFYLIRITSFPTCLPCQISSIASSAWLKSYTLSMMSSNRICVADNAAHRSSCSSLEPASMPLVCH